MIGTAEFGIPRGAAVRSLLRTCFIAAPLPPLLSFFYPLSPREHFSATDNLDPGSIHSCFGDYNAHAPSISLLWGDLRRKLGITRLNYTHLEEQVPLGILNEPPLPRGRGLRAATIFLLV